MNLRHMTSKYVKEGLDGLMIFVFVLVSVSSGVIAQESEDDMSNRAGALEEVVVSARKRDENLQDVPISIAVFSEAEIEAKSLTSLSELSQFTPNFSMYNNGVDGSLTNDIVMRGIGNSLGGPSVGIYLDGVYLSTQQAVDLGMLDIERVEILRGPQGTLFGRNTIGGAVSYVSAKPTGEFSGNAQLDVGSFNRFDAKVNLNGPLIEGVLNGRIAVGVQNRDGFMKVLDYHSGQQIDHLGDRDRWGARLLLDWIISDDVNVLFSVETSDNDEKATPRTVTELTVVTPFRLYNQNFNPDPVWGNNLVPPNLHSTYATYRSGEDNFNYLKTLGGSITVNWNISDNLQFKSITAYREYETGFGSDFDFSPHDISQGRNYTEQSQWSQEFQLTGSSLENRFNWVAGFNYFSEDAWDPSRSMTYTPLIERGLLSDSRRWIRRTSTNDAWAVFGEGTFDITDKLSATLGLRYTVDKKTEHTGRVSIADGDTDPHGKRLITNTSCIGCRPFVSGDIEIDDTSGRANLAYKWTDSMMTYGSVARGFKSGGLADAVIAVSNPRGIIEYYPEYVWTYELGMKSTLLDDRLRFNLAAFLSDYEDIQYQFFALVFENGVPVSRSVVSNAPSASIKGFELDMVYEPIDSLTFMASVGRTDANYEGADERGGPLSLESEFLQTPEWTYALSAEYRIPTAWGDLSTRLDYAWRDSVYFDITNTTNPDLQQEAYSLLNARISLDVSADWRLALFATNLLDQEYIIGSYNLAGTGVPAMVQPGAPREWGLMVKYNF